MSYNLVIFIDDDEEVTKTKKLFDKNNLTYKRIGKKMVIGDKKGHALTILKSANIDYYVVSPITRIDIIDDKEIPEVERLLNVNRIDYKLNSSIIIDVMDEIKVCNILNKADIAYDII